MTYVHTRGSPLGSCRTGDIQGPFMTHWARCFVAHRQLQASPRYSSHVSAPDRLHCLDANRTGSNIPSHACTAMHAMRLAGQTRCRQHAMGGADRSIGQRCSPLHGPVHPRIQQACKRAPLAHSHWASSRVLGGLHRQARRQLQNQAQRQPARQLTACSPLQAHTACAVASWVLGVAGGGFSQGFVKP